MSSQQEHTFTEATWISDASHIKPHICQALTFQSGNAETWLNQPGKCYLVSFKGCGRTHLLQTKRFLLEQDPKNQGVHFVPSDNPYVDAQELDATIDQAHLDFLSLDYDNDDANRKRCSLDRAKQLWRIALWLSILSNRTPDDFRDFLEAIDEKDITSQLEARFFGRNGRLLRIRPTSSIMILMSLSENQLHKLINLVDDPFKAVFNDIVQSGVFVFIDAGENVSYRYGREFWINMQMGLLLAAESIRTDNNHVRFYCAFRQEAYSRFTNVDALGIDSLVVRLDYKRDDLHGLLNHLIKIYEKTSNVQEWFGGDKIKNKFTKIDEDVFDYLYRHTIQRPRDFIFIGQKISGVFARYKELHSQQERDERIEQFRREVDRASDEILDTVLNEATLFLDSLSIESNRRRLWRLIHTNILTFDEMAEVCKRYNNVTCVRECRNGECPRNVSHPFCELYHIGMLGIIHDDRPNESRNQFFLKPYSIEFLKAGQRMQNTSPVFLLHPALAGNIDKDHNTAIAHEFRYIKGVTVGQGRSWIERDDYLVKIQKWIERQSTELRALCERDIDNIYALDDPYSIQVYRHWEALRDTIQQATADDAVLASINGILADLVRPLRDGETYALQGES